MRKIIKQLLVLLVFSVLLIPLVQAAETTKADEVKHDGAAVKKYPPYPDVWDWVTPFPSRMSYRLQAELLSNGDVQLSYRLKSRAPKPSEDLEPQGEKHSVLFFAKQPVPPPKDFYAYIHHHKERVKLPNGTTIRSSGAWEISNCFHAHSRDFRVHNTDETERGAKVLFFVLDHPTTFVPSGMCEGMPYDDPPFSYRMVSMLGGLIPLEDNTFLVVDYEHGVVIRFDEQWQSKSPLLNRRIFIMDKQEFNAFIRNKKYEKSEAEGYGLRWQVVDEDLYHYLFTTKGRR